MPSVELQWQLGLSSVATLQGGNTDTVHDLMVSLGVSDVREDVLVEDNYGKKVIWSKDSSGLTTFEVAYLWSDLAVWVELRNDDSGTPEFVRFYVPAKALVMIPPKFGVGTATGFDGAVLVDNTDYADTDRVEVMRNEADAIGDAKVKLYVFG
jgi:hypothetical protein